MGLVTGWRMRQRDVSSIKMRQDFRVQTCFLSACFIKALSCHRRRRCVSVSGDVSNNVTRTLRDVTSPPHI
ncbi:hypothetical protein J6590_044796 [Homalodisca vitripennis]|nr:hypothetical protein J6590_044796 [Homalodisca vitripennis]